MEKKGRANKNNTVAVKNVEQEVPKEEPVPESPKEPEMSLGEKKLLKQREKVQREEQERLKREAQAAQLQKQENKAHANKSKSKTQKIKLDGNYSESSQQSSPEKVVQDKEQKVPSGQIEKISLKEEIRVKQEPEPIQSPQNVYRDEPSIDDDFWSCIIKKTYRVDWANDTGEHSNQFNAGPIWTMPSGHIQEISLKEEIQVKQEPEPIEGSQTVYMDKLSIDTGLSGNSTMKNEPDDWENDTDEHCNEFNAGPSNTDSGAFFSDNRSHNRDSQGGSQWTNRSYNRNRQPNRDGSTSNLQQERGGYRGNNRNPRGGTDYRNDNRNSSDRGNYNRGSNSKQARGFSSSLRGSDRGGYNRDNRSRNYSPNWNNRSPPQQYDSKPPKTNFWDRNKPKQENWDETVKVGEWEAQPQNTENQQSFADATQDAFSYSNSAQDNYDTQPNYSNTSQYEYTQTDSSGYVGSQSYQKPEETGNLNYNNPPQNYTEDHNIASSDYQIQSDDSSWDIQTAPAPDQSPLNTSGGDQDVKHDFPELPQSQAKPQFNQSDDQKVTSRNQSNEASWRDSYRTPRIPYKNHRDRNQSYEQDAGNYSADKKRNNESFNSSADSSFNRSGYNNSYRKRDSYGRFSDGGDKGGRYGNNKYRSAERNDIEFSKFNKLSRQDRPINNGKLREETGDLFVAPVEYSLAHCVAEDMSMGAGIAKTFRLKFGRVSQLLEQDARTGGLAVLEDGERFIYYLVTKERSQGKPTMYTLWLSLNKLKDHCEQHGVKKLALPQIGCGQGRLYWSEVKQLLEYVFRDMDIEIAVYTPESDCSGMNHRQLPERNYLKHFMQLQRETLYPSVSSKKQKLYVPSMNYNKSNKSENNDWNTESDEQYNAELDESRSKMKQSKYEKPKYLKDKSSKQNNNKNKKSHTDKKHRKSKKSRRN